MPGVPAKSGDEQINDPRWLGLYTKKLEWEIAHCFRYFRDRGVEPILFKGWVAARNYPALSDRPYIDLDLAFSDDDLRVAKTLQRGDSAFKFTVDLHRHFRNLDSRPWADVFRDSEIVELEGERVRIPSPEDHLRILAVHWLNDGGERKHRLWDVYYAVENRPDTFSWELCLDTVSKTRRQWVIAAIGVAHRYFGLSLDGLPFADEALRLPDWMTRTIDREWASEVRLRPLARTIRQPREFIRQVLKRFPPNPIQSTVEMEGDLFSSTRLGYQLGSIKRRLLPSARDLRYTLRRKSQ